MKETFYFTHDYNARSDEKIKKLIRKHGMEGYGLFWSIIEDLYQNANALRTDCEGIAFDMRVDESMVKSILYDFDLFIVEGDIFGSKSVETRLLERDKKSSKARDSARKRWEKKDANALRTQSEGNAIKEKKRKEKKEKETGNVAILEEKIQTIEKGSIRYDFYSFLLEIEIEQEIKKETIEAIDEKLEYFYKALGKQFIQEMENFIIWHKEKKTKFSNILLRLNSWFSKKLPN